MRNFICTTMLASVMLWTAGSAFAVEQPHMEATLRALENAKHEIEIADAAHDHGGHAGEATRLIEEAIHQVREGIRFRDTH